MTDTGKETQGTIIAVDSGRGGGGAWAGAGESLEPP